jgi:hypothetical protein
MKTVEAAGVTGAVLGLGAINYATGYDLSFFVFYLIPIALVASRHGAPAGYLVSGLCAVTWFTADWLAGHPYARPWMGVWNAATRLVAFACLAHTIGRIRRLLAAAHQEVRTLRGFLAICAQCKKIQDDQGYWQQLEAYLAQHTDVQFSHGLCDQCLAATLRNLADAGPTAPRTPPGPPPAARPSAAGS